MQEALLATLPLVPFYGYFKDFFLLLERLSGTDLAPIVTERVIELLASQLLNDEKELTVANGEGRTPKLSLCAKWCPREGTYFDKKLRIVKPLAMRLFSSVATADASVLRRYRLLLSRLNRALDTTEILCSAKQWSEIQFSRVSSLCLHRLRKAFLNEKLNQRPTSSQELTGNRHPEDEDRIAARKNLMQTLRSTKGVKGAAMHPHEFVSACECLSDAEAAVLQRQWESMRDGVKEVMEKMREAANAEVLAAAAPGSSFDELRGLAAALPSSVDLGRLVPLVDVSGSMRGTPMNAAIGLGILVSELTHTAFKHRILTFEETPRWFQLDGDASIDVKVSMLRDEAPAGGSTNFALACQLILETAASAKLTANELPDLIVFSDMQFDQADDPCGGWCASARQRASTNWETHFERLQRRFAEVGRSVCGEPYPLPRIIFWNLRGDTYGFPAAANARNTQMLSGFSPALLKLLLTGGDIGSAEDEAGPTPGETVRRALNDSAFDPIRLALMDANRGIFAGYHFVTAATKLEDEEFEMVKWNTV
mmetsp:Transcript_36424/g.76692  ORF Transcript_36424/g.76692 Transcript_36424/m.76692 type:complete len:539 (-) Transcript_36424:405-2021(-)